MVCQRAFDGFSCTFNASMLNYNTSNVSLGAPMTVSPVSYDTSSSNQTLVYISEILSELADLAAHEGKLPLALVIRLAAQQAAANSQGKDWPD